MASGVARALRSAAASPAFTALVAALERSLPSRPGLLTVLAYHRVDEPGTLPLYPGLVSATPAEFRAQVAWLASRFHVVSLADVVAARLGEAALPRRAMLVTFDDAYRDFGEHAWPALREAGLPVTLFVPTGYPGSPQRPFWWERLYAALSTTSERTLVGPAGTLPLGSPAERTAAYRRVRAHVKALPHEEGMAVVDEVVQAAGEPALPRLVLSWEELRALAAAGVTLAPHTRTHLLLDRVSAERALAEAELSLADLEREIGPTVRALAYPSGASTPAVREGLAGTGFHLAFTIGRLGVNDLRRSDWLRLDRLNVTRTLGLHLLRAAVLPPVARLGPRRAVQVPRSREGATVRGANGPAGPQARPSDSSQ